MKKTLFLSVAAALSLFAGCHKAEFTDNTQPATGVQTIRVSVSDFGQVSSNGPTTKLAADDITAATVKFKWELNDTLALVNTSSMDVFKFVCTDATEGAFTKFTETDLPTDVNYYAIYPLSGVKSAFDPATHYETYRGNQIPPEHIVLSFGPNSSGYSHDAATITLDMHADILHILLKGDAKVGKITYSLAGDEKEWTILSCGDGVQLTSTPTDFYIDALATSCNGFSVSIYDTEGNKLVTKSSTLDLTKTYNFNTIVDMPVLTVNATPSLPAGALSGVFTVADPDGTPNSGDETKVYFSKGNLWADGSALHFEDSQ